MSQCTDCGRPQMTAFESPTGRCLAKWFGGYNCEAIRECKDIAVRKLRAEVEALQKDLERTLDELSATDAMLNEHRHEFDRTTAKLTVAEQKLARWEPVVQAIRDSALDNAKDLVKRLRRQLEESKCA